MKRLRLLAVLSLVLLAGCGELPHPFEHDPGAEPVLATPTAMAPIAVAEVADQPGLADAVVKALGEQDIPASVADGGDRFLHLSGQAGSGRVLWTLAAPDGKKIGESVQALPRQPGGFEPVAAATAEAVGGMLRVDDLGGTDLAARPRVMVDEVTATGGLDAALLKRALIMAIQQHGIAVVSDKAKLHVSGGVRVSLGMAGRDLVEVSWAVIDDEGKELGRVNQSNNVYHDELVSLATRMTHQIAEGGAEGVAQLVHMKR
jgi:hypothetical protein